jgi:hypothetical protein
MTRGDEVWTTEEEDFLSNLEKQCNSYYDHNIKEFQYYNKMASRFNIPILVISALNSLCAIALNDFLPQRFVSILNAVLSAGTGVLGSIQLYMKLNEKMTNAMRASIHFKKLALKISKELTIARKDRTTEGQTFLTDCFSEFNTVLEQGNPIEKKIKNHLEFLAETPLEDPPSPLKNVAGRFFRIVKSVTPSVRSGNSFEELRRESLVRQLGHRAGSGSGTPESEP